VPAVISQEQTDYVVCVKEIGDNAKIGKGAARVTSNPRDLQIARNTAKLIAASGYFENGFSFQTGAGAIPIACTKFIGEQMERRGIRAGFALGGVTSGIIELLQKNLIDTVQAVQSFDATSAQAQAGDSRIVECDASRYANPDNKGCMVNRLDIAVLGALEVDTDFNVNILTGSSGEMMSGLGGGPDVAAGANLSIIAIPLFRGRTPSVVPKVLTLCTPGSTVAAVVTEVGVALNPKHRNYDFLRENLTRNGRLRLYDIEQLRQMAEDITGVPKPIPLTEKVVAIVEYRDGSVLDVIRQLG
jgi:citrate lyase subunit alpha/citrate CoA-transferase